MNLEEIREYCLTKPHCEETLPFGPDVLVFKTNNKAFLLLPLDEQPVSFNVKCDPELALHLREKYPAVIPGYHMNKKHWNTIEFHSDVNDKMMYQLINDSYDLVFKSLTKKIQSEIKESEN